MCNRCRRAHFYFNRFATTDEIFRDIILMPRTRYLANLLGQESILVLFYSIKYSAVDKMHKFFFLYRIVFFISSINDIRYFIFVIFCDICFIKYPVLVK